MGRSVNSFTNWVGDNSMEGDRVTLPEKDLWVAVLSRAALDACNVPPRLNLSLRSNVTHKNNYTYNRDQARHFFMTGGSHFNLVCELAGRNPVYVQQQVRKIILRKNGWNVDVPVTSHYRQGRGRPGKKRGRPRKKDLKMVLQGRKGGRPKLYVV
jgi:hypothetical protein